MGRLAPIGPFLLQCGAERFISKMTVDDLGITTAEFVDRCQVYTDDSQLDEASCLSELSQMPAMPAGVEDIKIDLSVSYVGHKWLGMPAYPRSVAGRAQEMRMIQAYRQSYPDPK